MRRFATVIFGLLLSTPAFADGPCDSLPPLAARRPITVPLEVFDLRADIMNDSCESGMLEQIWGCAMRPAQPGRKWIILLSASLSPTERYCTLMYEKAHLPPNNWYDPAEDPHTWPELRHY